MRWEVQGADAAADKETTINVEALTAEEAEHDLAGLGPHHRADVGLLGRGRGTVGTA